MEEDLAVIGRGGAGIGKVPEGLSAIYKFTVGLKTAGLNATELSAYCRERGLYPGAGGTLAPKHPRMPITIRAHLGRAKGSG
jgi:hypothetical protein